MNKILKHLDKIVIFLSLAIVIYLLLDLFVLNGRPLFKKDTNPINTENSATVTEPVTADIFYWGEGCPHCETVEEWLEVNNQQNTLKINSKEVYKNQNNSKELIDTVNQYCPQLQGESGIGVPTGFDPISQKCFQGSDEIIKFLSDKLTK